MKVFLIIIGISVVLNFIVKIADVILGRKKLRLENSDLKIELAKANKTIRDNLGEFAKFVESSESYKEIESLKSRNAELLMENMQLKSLIGAYRNACGNPPQNLYGNSAQKIPQGTIEAVKYAMKKSHPDNGGNAKDFMRFQKVYEELTRK